MYQMERAGDSIYHLDIINGTKSVSPGQDVMASVSLPRFERDDPIDERYYSGRREGNPPFSSHNQHEQTAPAGSMTSR